MTLSSPMHTAQELTLALQSNQLLRLTHARGRRIRCITGVAWLTAYGEAKDIMLHASNTFVIPNHRLNLVEAIGDCVIGMDCSAEQSQRFARRFIVCELGISLSSIRLFVRIK